MRNALCVSTLSAVVIACASGGRVNGESLVVTRQAELVAAMTGVAGRMAAGEFVTPLSSFFAPTGVYVNALPLSLRGPANARAWMERDTLNPKSTARMTILGSAVSTDGRDGFAYGYFDVVRPTGDTLPGQYHAYLRRSSDGAWQILAFSRGRRAAGPIVTTLPASVAATIATMTAYPSPDSTAALERLMATERAFSDSAGTSVQAAFVGFAAPNAAKLERGSLYVFGPAAINEMFSGPTPPGGGPLWSPEVGTVASSGDIGFTAGPVRLRRPVEGVTAPPGAKYFTIWRRLPNGDWRYVVD